MREKRQKNHATWSTRILTHILCLTLVLASLPNIPLDLFQNPKTGVNLQAVEKSPPTTSSDDSPLGGGETHQGEAGNETNTMPGGSILNATYSNIEDGSSYITKAGIYVGNDKSNYLNIYMNQKKASNNICYRTVGFAVTKNKAASPDLSFAWTFPRVEIGINYNDCNVVAKTGYYTEGNAFHAAPNIEFTNKDSNNKIYQNDTYYIGGQEYTGTNFKVSKLALRKYLGLPADSKQTVYLHSINNIRNSAGTWVKKSSQDLFRSAKATQSVMQSMGFSSTSQNDMKKMYNIPIGIDPAKYTISILDVQNCKVLKFNTIYSGSGIVTGGAIIPKLDLGTLCATNNLISEDINNGTKYDLLGGCIISNNFPESATNSGYLDSVVRPNLQAGVQPEKAFYMSTAQANEVAKTGYSPTADLSENAKYTLDGFIANKSGFMYDIFKYGDKYAKSPTASVIDETDSILFGITNDLSLGLNMYLFVQPSQNQLDLEGDFAVGYAADTGNKLWSEPIDYTEMQEEINSICSGFEIISDSEYKNHKFTYDSLMDQNITETHTVDMEYEMPSCLQSPSGSMYVYEAYNYRTGTTLAKDVQLTKTERTAGKDVLHDGVKSDERKFKVRRSVQITTVKSADNHHPIEEFALVRFLDYEPTIYRGKYVNSYEVPVLYYSSLNGELICKDYTSPSTSFLAQDCIDYNGKKYYTKQVSYKEHITAEEDISKTTVPVMTGEDKGLTNGRKLTIPDSVINNIPTDYIIRVSCDLTPNPPEDLDLKEFIIPAQHLTYNFSWTGPAGGLQAHAEEKLPHIDYEHTYTSGYDSEGNAITSICHVTDSYNYKTHLYDWNDDPDRILSPLTNVFADRGVLTTIGSLKAQGSFDISTTFSMKFTSHREAVDNVAPVFAKYMYNQNKSAIEYLKSHKMQNLAVSDLTPNNRYSNTGGEKSVSVSIGKGTKSEYYGIKYDYSIHHSSCGVGTIDIIRDGVQSSEATSGSYKGVVKAEPSIVATPKEPATALVESVGTVKDRKTTYYSTGAGNIKFYPTYKMFVDGKDAWLLGKEERQLKAINVAEIEVMNTQPVVDMATTWSRDAQDTGRPSMKSGYVYKTKTKEPMKVKVVTYSVVPKIGYVKDSEAVRNKILKNHSDLVSQLSDKNNYMLLTNLPEASLAKWPAEWKKTNPFKTGSDNTVKCKLNAEGKISISKGATTSTTMTLEAMDAAFDKCDNVERLKAQLETNDWYVEKFDGFEVIKQVTEISITCGEVSAVNFVRNGGKITNDLAQPAGNISAGTYGLEIGYYCPTTKIYGVDFDIQKLTLPKVFEVRGTAYDDRSN